MAITGPADLPSVLKVHTEGIKKYIYTKLGYPQVEVELSEDQLETIIRVAGDFISGYFPREQKLAVFYTTPLRSTYPLPTDAYWVQEVSWDASTTRIGDIFGAEAYLINPTYSVGVQNILTDYVLLQQYRKFSQEVMGTRGHWEVINEGSTTVTGDSLSSKDQLIRLYPTPKSVFPVLVLYIPVVNHFRSPQARFICYDMILAEAKITLGNARRKIAGMPSPDGGSISYDGDQLVQEGETLRNEIIQKAIDLGEPLPIIVH